MKTAAQLDAELHELEAYKAKLMRIRRLQAEIMQLEVTGRHAENIQLITEIVSRRFEVRIELLIGKRRHQWICDARFVIWHCAREFTSATLEDIGRLFSGRDHGTVLCGITRLKALCECNPAYRSKVDAALAECRAAFEKKVKAAAA